MAEFPKPTINMPMDAVIWSSGPYNENYNTVYRYLGPYKIAHYCRKTGYNIQVIDHISNMTEEQLYLITKKFITAETKILAISTTFLCQITYSWGRNIPYHVFTCLTKIKKEFPNLKIISGGYQSTSLVEFNDLVDASIINYGEDIFLELLEHYKLGKDEPIFEMKQLLSSTKNKMKSYTAVKNPTYDISLDDHLFTKQDCIVPNETLPIEISRGCIFSCRFCNHLLLGRGKLDYLRDFELVKNELIHNYENFGTTNYFIICDTFNDTTTKMNAWHNMVSSLPFKIRYTSYLRADLLHAFPDVPYQLKETGLYAGFHGIESFGEIASKAVGKGWSSKHSKEYLPYLYHDVWNKEVHQTLGFIVGLPGDTRESLIDTASWFKTNDLDKITFHTLQLRSYHEHRIEMSQFEKDSAKYGYRFNNKIDDNWITDYWNKSTADMFNKSTLMPSLYGKNSWTSGWDMFALMTYGFSDNEFDKKFHIPNTWKDFQSKLNACRDEYMQKYYNLLLSL